MAGYSQDVLDDESGGASALTPESVSAPPPSYTRQQVLDDESGGMETRKYEPPPEWNWSDIPKGVAAGYHVGVAAPLDTLSSAIAQNPDMKRAWAISAQQQRQAFEESEAGMTPGATKTWPVWMAEQAAPIAAQALPITMAGPLGFGSEAAALGAGAVTGGVMATSQYRSDVAGAIDKASHEDLMRDPEYAFQINNGVPEGQARFNLTQRNYSLQRDLGVGALGAFAGGISAPVMSAAANPLLRVLDPSARGLIGVALRGGITAGEATVPIAAQMTGQAYATQEAAHEASAGPAPTVESVWPDTRALALAGGIGFGAGALKAPYHPGIDVKPREPSKTTTATTAEPGKATSVGSSREGAKPKEEEKLGAKEKTATILDAAGNQPAAPPPPPEQQTETSAGPEVSAALDAVARTEGGVGGERAITPESEQPQSTPVNTTQVAQNVQPMVEMPQDQQGRPPVGVKPSQVSIPMEGRESPPAAQPGAPVRPETVPAPGAERTIPEPDQALSAQQKEIASGARDFVFYPPGTTPPPHLKGVNRAVVQGDDVIRVPYGKKGDLTDSQVFDFSPKVKDPLDKIKFALANDRLNELLKLGPTTKTEVAARVDQGETPIVATVRDEAGNELKAAAGTTETAPAQVQALEEGKASPEHAVQVERPEDVISERFAKARAENIAREQAQAPQKVTPTGRTLESVRSEDQAAAAHTAAIEAQHAQTIEEQLKARQAEKVAAEKAATEAQKTGKHWTKGEIAKVNQVNKIADNVTAAHRAASYEDPKAVFDAAKAMTDAAKKAGIEIPEQFNEGHPYNPNVVRLREAADLVESAKRGREAFEEGLGRFIHRDSLIDAGRVADALENRRAEGAAMQGLPEGAEPGMRAGPKGGAVDEEGKPLEEREGYVSHETPPETITPKSEEEVRGGEEKEDLGPARERPKLELAEGEGYRAGKATVGFQREVRKVRGVNRQEIREPTRQEAPSPLSKFIKLQAEIEARKAEMDRAEKAVKGPKTIITRHDNGSDIEIQTKRESTVRELLSGVDYSKYTPELRPMMKALVDRMIKVVGHLPVYWASDAEIAKTGARSYGQYVHREDHIIMNDDVVHPDGVQTTSVHEVFHAAISEMYDNEPEFRANIDQLQAEAVAQWSKGLDTAYGFTEAEENAVKNGGQEFLTELMSNPSIQAAFKKIRISSDLAKKLDIPRWRKASLWEGLLGAIRNAFHMPTRYVSVIEAGMNIAETGMHGRDRGELMEYAGRWSKATAGELGPLDKISGMRVGRESFEDIFKYKEPPSFKQIMSAAQNTLGSGEKEREGVEDRLDSLVPDFAKTVASDLKTNVGYYARKGMLKVLAPTQIAGFARKMFMDKESIKTGSSILDDLNHSVEARHQEFAKLNEGDRAFLAKSYHLAKQYSQNMNDFGRLLDMSGKYGIHADQDAPKERANVEQGAMENWQAVKYGPETRALLASMPDELREHYTELKDFYKEKAQSLAKAHIQNVLDIFDPLDRNNLKSAIERNERVNRVLAHSMSDEDMAYYRNLPGDRNVVTEINKLYGFLNPKGVYFNAYRDGDFTVTGRYAMPAGGNDASHSGEELPDNVREFDTRKEAHDFATSTEMHATPSIVRYVKDPDNPGQFLDHTINPDTGKPMGILAQDADVTKYRVALQREHTEMGRTPAQAERAREEMIKLGVKNVSQVLDKRKEENWTQLNNANAKAFESKINDRNDLSRTEKQKLIQASRQLGLMSQSGNRMAKYWTTRRNISGANYNEIYQAAHNYANASNFHMANSKVSGDIDKAMTRLDKHEESTRESDNAYQISSIANHMRDRVYAGPDSLSPRTPTWLRALKVMAFSKYLLTPRFIVQHQLHPLAFTAPQMAGRHGYMNSVGYLWHALSDVGGNIPNIGEGFKASGRMAKALLGYGGDDIDARIAASKPLDMVDRIIAKINANSSREGGALRALQKGGALHSGFDDEFYGASGLDKVDLLMRQTTNAMEATNRTVAGLGAYRAEYDRLVNMGKSSQTAHEAAIRYAQQTVENSMGVFSPTNMANMFKHPYLRAALQFKQFPLQQTYAFLRNVHEAFKGESLEARKEATRAATAQMLSAATMTGVHGLPLLGVLKAGGLLGMALGVTPSPSQIDDRTYRLLADKLSPGVAKAIMTGPLSALSPYMPDVSNVFGYSGDFFYGEPHNNDWKSYAWDQLGGAPLSAANDTWNGMADVWHGDMAKGISKLAPIGAISNLARAFTLGSEGAQTTKGLQITPASPEAAMLKILGFTTQQQSRAYGGRQALEEDIQESKDQKTQALDQARKGNMSAVLKWNNANPHDRISPQQASQARKGQSAQSILGVKITPRNRARLEEFQVYQ